MEDLKILQVKRSSIKASITKMKSFMNSYDVGLGKLSEIRVRNQKLEQLYNDFVEIHNQIISITCDTNDNSFDEFEDNYFLLKSAFEEILNSDKVVSSPGCNTNSSSQNSNGQSHDLNFVNLPKFNLPVFEGKYENWVSFFDLFQSTIHQNQSLSDIQRFYYLKSYLKGEPLNLLSTLPLSQSNYNVAMELLKERYANQKIIVNTHLKALFSLPQVNSLLDLKSLLDITIVNVRALENLGYKTKEWDVILVYFLISKFDQHLRTQWELSNTTKEVATFAQLEQFIKQYIQALETSQDHKLKSNANVPLLKQVKANTTEVFKGKRCPICQQEHALFKCNDFLNLKPSDRLQKVKQLRRCLNCLSNTHMLDTCKATKCKVCSKAHNTLLHIFQGEEPKSFQVDSGPKANTKVTSNNSNFSNSRTMEKQPENNDNAAPKLLSAGISSTTRVLLSTAMIQVKDSFGQYQSCRALIDPGSEGSFITQICLQKLGLSRQPFQVPVLGVGNSHAGYTRGLTSFTIKTKQDEAIQVKAYIMNKLTTVPSFTSSIVHWFHIQNLDLADPFFYKSGQMDIILGADIYTDLLLDGIVRGSPNTPSAINSKLGYLLSGKVSDSPSGGVHSFRLAVDNSNLNTSIERFWKIEEVNQEPASQSQENDICENHFLNTYSRDESGRFCVRLPFKPSIIELGDSFSIAYSRFKRLESTLSPENYEKYHAFMKEYLDLGHMHPTPKENSPVKSQNPHYYYLPNHAVYRESSSTTKTRVVFDASCKTTSGTSLNDHLYVGPKLQTDIMPLLIRFRLHKVVFTADIEKFYRQISVAKTDQCYQRILWRTSPQDPIQSFDLATVTYGTSCAPYLSIRCLHQLSDDVKDHSPEVSRILKEDFYVDDLVSGADSIEHALEIKSELVKTMSKAGFPLRKWSSNAKEILDEISHSQTIFQFQSEDALVKLLGLFWDPNKDIYQYSINSSNLPNRITKRNILSEIARLFDPLGLLCPVVTKAKLIMQKTWLSTTSWDETVSDELSNEFKQYYISLSHLKNLQVPRALILFDSNVTYELFGFSDASEKAYAAVIYLRSVSSSDVKVQLVCAKSRVSPLKKVTIPRLELSGALLLAQLANKIQLILPTTNTYLFTDSKVVLAWLSKPPETWKAFVNSRVSQIQSLTNISDWNHIISEENPADLASRGIFGNKLINHDQWWVGPSWLSNRNLEIHSSIHEKVPNIPEKKSIKSEKKSIKCSLLTKDDSYEWYLKYSSFTKAIRITAFCKRFVNNLKNSQQRQSGPLTPDEIDNALLCILKQIQNINFQEEIVSLQKKDCVKRTSKLASLHPFLDEQGILRVGGRIQKSNQPFDIVHQIILPTKHQFVRSLIIHLHKVHLHVGIQFIMNILRQKYWLIGNVRSSIRDVIRKCPTCCRFSSTSNQPLMGNLPESRVTFTRCFLNTGCDFAGPFLTKQVNSRSKVVRKTYLLVFVCMGVKAVHLELVSDLSTETFMAAFNRFTCRRGIPENMYSDNGTSFVGADNSIKRFLKENKNSIKESSAFKGITWHFIPPHAPNMGGLWESAVKSAKHHMKRVIGNQILSFEELNTLTIQVEAILNSRPLCRVTDDQSEVNILTPAHFLIGENLISLPEKVNTRHINYNKRWQLIQRMRISFWERWNKEYLHTLQQRHKWKFQECNAKEGDIVLIKEDNISPMKFAMGRITKLFPGPDNITRVVELKTQNGLIKRPVNKLLSIPSE